MFGAILGDVIGSAYEFAPVHDVYFNAFRKESTFTDDSVLTLATADVLLNGGNYADAYWSYARAYPGRGYGGRFAGWISSNEKKPYNSFGNGSAMRIAPVGWAFDTLEATLAEAEKSAACTHNHPEGVKGAQAVAAAIFMARNGADKSDIQRYIETTFNYDLSRSVDEVRKTSYFDETCQVSVPEAIVAFLGADDYEQTVRNCVSFGADADTQAAIAGAIAEAYWDAIGDEWILFAWQKLDARSQDIVLKFYERFAPASNVGSFIRRNA